MSNFTSLLDKGKRRYVDKYLRPRKFGKCEGCSKPALLIEYKDAQDSKASLLLCEHCYTIILNDNK
ncbi:MAG: hypothetical protein WC516_07090 [Patescibacteria group bacterium]|jgi:hypothetical protein